MLSLVHANVDTGRQKCAPKKPHKESERKHTTHSQQLLHFVYCHRHPGELCFLLFGGRYLLDSASVYSLPLAPHLVLSLGLGVLLP